MTLGQNIQNARRVQGLSQEALAEKIGVSRQALGKWEKDTALPGLDNLQALAAALGIGVDALLGAENADPAVPAVTLDALRDLLAARDAEEKRRRRVWGCAGGAAFIVLAGLLAGVALQYERQISALNQNYAAIQSQLRRPAGGAVGADFGIAGRRPDGRGHGSGLALAVRGQAAPGRR